MKQREKRNIIIGILYCMVVFMSVGYAALSQNLKINGTANITGSWKIEITSISPKEINEGESVSEVIEDSKVAGSFVANLKKPTDAVEYTVTVENKGTIDAVLESITPEDYSNGDIKYTTTGKEECKYLNAGARCNFTIKVVYADTGVGQNPIPKGTEVSQTFTILYVQETSNFDTMGQPGGDILIPTDEPAITVDENGTVVSYNKEKLTNSEGYVVIPATTEKGEEIVSIDALSFTKLNAANVYAYNDTTSEEVEGYIIYDEENYDTIKSILMSEIGDSGSGSGSYSSSSSVLGKDINPTNIENKKTDGKTLKKLSGSGSGSIEELSVYTKTQFDALVNQMGGKDEVIVETEYMYVDLETGESTDEFDDFVIKGVMAPIEKIDLSNAVHLKKIDELAFAGSSLKEIKLGNTVEEIRGSAFQSAKLTSLTLPNSLKIIGGGAFEFNELSDAIIIPESVTSIGNGFIDGNCNLKKIIIKRANGEGITFGKDWLGSAEKYCGTGAVTPEVIYDPNYVG